jgi:hypothetical protein
MAAVPMAVPNQRIAIRRELESFSACGILLGKISLCLQPIFLVPSVHSTAFKVYFVGSLPNLLDTRGARELRLSVFKFNRFVRLVLSVFCTCDCSFRAHLFSLSI